MGHNVPLGAQERRDINDALNEAYQTAAKAGVDINARRGFDKGASAFQVETAIQDAFYELNKKVEENPDDQAAKKARDDLYENLQQIGEARETLIENGIDPNQFGNDQPLQTGFHTDDGVAYSRQEFEGDDDRATEQDDATIAKQTEALAATRLITNADDAAEAGSKNPLKDAELTQDTEGSALVRGTYQCFLLYNLKAFAQVHRSFLFSGASNTQYEAASKDGEIKTAGYWSKNTKKPKILLTEELPGTGAAINRLQVCGGDEAFSAIKTSEYAELQPLLKIYKIFSNDKKGMVEMKFGTNTSLDGIAEQLTVPYPIGSKTSTMFGRGANSGIKSFEWKFLGSDPFTATRDVEATLKLHFQHFSELLKLRQSENLLISPAQAPQNMTYSYIDLIIQPDCRDKNASKRKKFTQRRGPECYEIRVDVGYHPPGNKSTLSKEIKKSIECQRQSLFLTLVDHKFDFKNDGTFDMVVTYRGRLGTIMRDRKFNILLPGGGFHEIQFNNPDDPNIKTGILDLEERILEERSKPEPSKETLKKYQRWKSVFFVNSKQDFYNGILSRLENAGMIFKEPLTDAQWQAFSRWQNADPGGLYVLPEPYTPRYSGPISIARASAYDAQVVTRAADTDVDAEGNSDPNAPVREQAEAETDRLAGLAKRKKEINYIFLGDLIAAVFDNVTGERMYKAVVTQNWWQRNVTGNKNTSGSPTITSLPVPSDQRLKEIIENFHIILGNMDVELARQGPPEEFTTNIAHIPISLEVFRQFWTEKVLMQDTTFYSFFDFLDDILQDLITQAVSSGCFGGLLDHPVRAQAVLISSKDHINDKIYKKGTNWKSVHINESTPKSPAFSKLIDIQGQDSTTPKQYLMLQVSDTAPHDLNGDYRQDVDRGIIHTGYGRDRGLLKSVQFQKTDQEYLPEARYANEGDFVFNQLANVYDATFNLLGNTIFSPGMHIYFDPTDQGIGSPPERKVNSSGIVEYQSWSNLMGLGGYHLVTEIANVIDRSGFSTTLKARWVTSGQMEG